MLPQLTWSFDPVFVRLGTGELRWFTLLWWLELVLDFWVLRRQVLRAGGDEEEAGDLTIYVWIGLIAGARLGQGFFYNLDRLVAEPAWLFKFYAGGMSGHGAIVGVVFAAWLFTRRRGMSLWEATDRLCYSAAISAIIHRLGSLLNSELVGVPTDGTWGVRFPHFDGAFVTSPPFRHPTPLYEVLLGFVVLATVTGADRAWGKELRPRGALTGVLLVVYFAGRLLLAPLREREGDGFSLPFNLDQALSVPFLLLGVFLLFRSLRHRARAGWLLPANTP